MHFQELKFEIKRKTRVFWKKYITLPWHNLWMRQDEFHCSLNLDRELFNALNKKAQERYLERIHSRRQLACRRSE